MRLAATIAFQNPLEIVANRLIARDRYQCSEAVLDGVWLACTVEALLEMQRARLHIEQLAADRKIGLPGQQRVHGVNGALFK